MARNSAVAAAQEAFFDRDWSRIRGSVPRARAKQMARAAMGHSPAIFKAIRDGGTHNKALSCLAPMNWRRRSTASTRCTVIWAACWQMLRFSKTVGRWKPTGRKP